MFYSARSARLDIHAAGGGIRAEAVALEEGGISARALTTRTGRVDEEVPVRFRSV